MAKNELDKYSRKNGELEDQVRRLQKELQTLAKLQRLYPNQVQKVSFIPQMVDAQTFTLPQEPPSRSLFGNIP